MSEGAPPLPRYRTIVADPPWPLSWSVSAKTRNGGAWGAHKHRPVGKRTIGYPVMSVNAIAALPIDTKSFPDSVLFLWTFDQFVLNGAASLVATEWGFTPKRFIVWKKPGFGLGGFPRPQHWDTWGNEALEHVELTA